jgi:MFS transporter, DHA2 family, multidrug resistance protein
MSNLKSHLQYNSGSSPSNASRQGQMMLFSNLNKQAFVEGINDDFLMASIITLIGGIPIIFLHTRKSKIQNLTEDEYKS